MHSLTLRQRPFYSTRHRGSKTQKVSRRSCWIVRATKDAESAEEALQRRLRESQRVEERVVQVYDANDFSKHVLDSDDSLVVVEVTSDEVCETGVKEEPELQWELDVQQQRKAIREMCGTIKHVFQRTARECRDVKFVAIDSDTENGSALADNLGIDTIPTLQFYRQGKLLWEHKGALHFQQDLGEGVLYYANTYAGGANASDFVFQIENEDDFEAFVNRSDSTLKVIDVSTEDAEPCIHIYPAVLALAKNFKGYVSFARLLIDNAKKEALGSELKILDVPTFLFYKEGKEVDRHAGSSRADLIGHILSIQGMDGLPPPPPQSPSSRRRNQPSQI